MPIGCPSESMSSEEASESAEGAASKEEAEGVAAGKILKRKNERMLRCTELMPLC